MREFSNIFSKKHGAWSIFFISIILGTLSAKNFNFLPFVLLFVASLSGFLLRENISFYFKLSKKDKRRKFLIKVSLIYLILISFTFLLLIFLFKKFLLIPISFLAFLITLISLYFSSRKKELTVPSEIFGIFGLSLSLPAFYYISSNYFDLNVLYLFIFAFLFFTGSVFHVRYLVRNKNILSENFFKRLKVGLNSISYHTLFFILSVYLSTESLLPQYSYIAVIPTLLKSYYFVLRKFNKPLPIKKIGFTELFHSIIFLILITILFYI